MGGAFHSALMLSPFQTKRGQELIDLATNAEKALRMVRESQDLVYDTETSGLDWRIHHPIGYVLGAPRAARDPHGTGAAGTPAIPIAAEDVVYVPVRHGGGGNLPGCPPLTSPTDGFQLHPFEEELAKAFEERNRKGLGETVGHNMKFDLHMSANSGVRLGRNLVCTSNQQAMLDEYQKSFSLDECAGLHGVTAKKGERLYTHMAEVLGGKADKKIMEHFWKLSGTDPVAYEYATGDGVTTWELHQAQKKQITKEEMDYIAHIENQLIWTVFRMERRGIKVDPDVVNDLRAATEEKIRQALEEFPLGFNVRSPVQMKQAMEDAGYTDWPRTEKGNPSFVESWLKRNPVGQKVIEIRRMSNLINSFIDPLMEHHVFKGRVHATLNQLKADEGGTISGRFSCQHPNLQQVPKRNKDIAKPFRRVFVADEGHIFWERDYSQCEPRLFAHYSGSQALLDGYNQTPHKDMHSVTAELLDVERDPTAKRMGMGILTGMQSKALAGHMNCSEDQASRWLRDFFHAYPEIKGFQDKAKYRLKNRGYVMTLLGRRCRLEAPRWAYRGTSKIIQGSNADIIKVKLLEADMACEQNQDIVHVAMTVHDSFNGQYQDTPIARKLFEEVVTDMEEVQCEPFNMRVPFLMEGEEGRNWSEATFGKDE